MKIAYMTKWVPKLSETFILNEMVQLIREGHEVIILADRPHATDIIPGDVERYGLMDRVIYPKRTAGNLADLAASDPGISTPLALRGFLRRSGREEEGGEGEAGPGAEGGAGRMAGEAPGLGGRVRRRPARRARRGMRRRVIDRAQDVALASRMQSEGVDLIHAHFAGWAPRARMLSRLTDIPYTFTAHAHDIFAEGALTGEVVETMREASGIVVISEYNRRFLTKNVPGLGHSKMKVIHCGIKLDEFEPVLDDEAMQIHKEGPEPDRILTVARFEPKKGLEHLIDAYGRLASEGIDFRAVMVGDGPLRPGLVDRVKEAGLEDRVKLTGAVDDERLARLYRTSDVFALPCVTAPDGDRDGIPVVLMEAMAMGIPVVSTEVSGIPELVDHGKNGLLVPEKDPEALADALELIMGDPGSQDAFGREGREKVERDFNIVHTVEELLENWESILRDRNT